MMAAKESEGELTDLKEVYEILQRDSKEMVNDLLSGVSMWRSASVICFILAFLGAVAGLAVVTYVGLVSQTAIGENISTGARYVFEGGPKIEVILIASCLFGVATVAAMAGVYYLRKYFALRKKYFHLQSILKKPN
jgi:hypothetical protein